MDDLTWRFELVPGATFANGEPADAAAVKWNIERILDPKAAMRIKAWFDPIKEVRVISPTTVEFVTGKPYASLDAQMSSFFVLPPKWTQANNPAIAAMPSGPYELVEFKAGDKVVLKARDGYWGEKPEWDMVTFRMVTEASTRVASLLAGEVDLIVGFAPSEMGRIKKSGRATVGAIPSSRFMMVKYNNLIPPFKDNPKLRLALNYAIDKQAIVDSLWDGLGSVANCQPMSDAYFGYNPALKPFPYDPAKAKQLLTEAGYPNGLEVEFEVPLGRYLQAEEISQIITAQLSEVGVTAKIKEMEFGQWLTKFRKAGNLGQTAYLGMAWPTMDADGLLGLFEPGNQYAYYENMDFAKAVQAGRSTTDPAERMKHYKAASEVMCADPPQIFLFHQPVTYAQSKRVKWHARGDSWLRAMDVSPQ